MATSLDYANGSTAQKKRSWRWLWITLVCTAISIGLILAYPSYRRGRAIRAVATAGTAADEMQAFKLVHDTHEQYEIRFFNAAGTEIMPHLTGDYASVHSIWIIWPNGSHVKTVLQDQRNLTILMMD